MLLNGVDNNLLLTPRRLLNLLRLLHRTRLTSLIQFLRLLTTHLRPRLPVDRPESVSSRQPRECQLLHHLCLPPCLRLVLLRLLLLTGSDDDVLLTNLLPVPVDRLERVSSRPPGGEC